MEPVAGGHDSDHTTDSEENPVRHDAKLDRIRAVPLFADTDRKHLEGIAQLCTELSAKAGNVLCREGEPGAEFFVLLDGTVTVTSGGRELATLGAGDFFGELALLDGKARNATVTAASDLQLLVLSRQEFTTLVHDDPQVAVRMLPAIGARLRGAAEPAQGSPVV